MKLFKHQNKTNAGCRIELSGVGNYPGAIALGTNCHMVIVCEAIILGGYVESAIIWGVLLGGNFFSKLFLRVMFLFFQVIFNM